MDEDAGNPSRLRNIALRAVEPFHKCPAFRSPSCFAELVRRDVESNPRRLINSARVIMCLPTRRLDARKTCICAGTTEKSAEASRRRRRYGLSLNPTVREYGTPLAWVEALIKAKCSAAAVHAPRGVRGRAPPVNEDRLREETRGLATSSSLTPRRSRASLAQSTVAPARDPNSDRRRRSMHRARDPAPPDTRFAEPSTLREGFAQKALPPSDTSSPCQTGHRLEAPDVPPCARRRSTAAVVMCARYGRFTRSIGKMGAGEFFCGRC